MDLIQKRFNGGIIPQNPSKVNHTMQDNKTPTLQDIEKDLNILKGVCIALILQFLALGSVVGGIILYLAFY